MKKVLLLITCLLLFTKIYAYENEYFSLDIDESFKEETIKNNSYLFSKGNEYISIVIEDNINEYDVNKFTDEDIQKQKSYLINKYKDKFSNYTKNVSITNIGLKNNDSYSYLEYDLHYETKAKIGYDIYQRSRMITSNNYVYTILYNSDKEITNNEYLDSFKIKDSYLRKINTSLYIILLIVMLGVIFLIDFLLHKKRR